MSKFIKGKNFCLSEEELQGLRALRLWHWKELLKYRNWEIESNFRSVEFNKKLIFI